jgi:hypothetical protein
MTDKELQEWFRVVMRQIGLSEANIMRPMRLNMILMGVMLVVIAAAIAHGVRQREQILDQVTHEK